MKYAQNIHNDINVEQNIEAVIQKKFFKKI